MPTIAPQLTPNANGVTTNSHQTTTQLTRFAVSWVGTSRLVLALYRMLDSGDWIKMPDQVVEIDGPDGFIVDFETKDVGERIMIVLEGPSTVPAGLTCILKSLPLPSFANGVTGVAAGGSGAQTLTNHGPLVGQGTNPIVAATPGTTHQFFKGVTGQDPAFSAIAAGDVPLGVFRPFKNVSGHNGAGALTCTGAKVGDKVLMAHIYGASPTTTATDGIEATVTVADQVQQTDVANLSAGKFDILLLALS